MGSEEDYLEQFAKLSPEKQAALMAKLQETASASASAPGEAKSTVEASGDSAMAGGDYSINIGGNVFLAAPDPGAVPPKTLLGRYLERLIGQVRNLKLDVIDRKSATEKSQLQLAAVFTELNVVRMRAAEEQGSTLVDEPAEVELRHSLHIDSAISQVVAHPKLALLGAPGSGKSTFVEMLALCLAGEILEDTEINTGLLGDDWETESPWLPVRVILRNFAAEAALENDYSLWKYIKRHLGDGLPGFGPLLKKHLIEEGGLLLLDGFDEVPEADRCRERVKKAVRKFSEDFGRVRILLTCRTYAWENQDWRLAGFDEAVLAPFEQEQWENFIDRWYRHLVEIRDNVTEGIAEAGSRDLKAAIASSAHLSELASSPLLLTLMASLHALRGGTLPRKREELYEKSVELLLDVWQKPKEVRHPDSGEIILQTESAAEFLKVDPVKFQESLEKIAFDAHKRQAGTKGTADIPEGDLVAGLIAATGTQKDCNPVLLADFLRDRAGILVHESPGEEGIYRFPHRTFQEYLAARYLTNANFPAQLCEWVHSEPAKWREVFLLAGAKAARGSEFSGWALVEQILEEPPPKAEKAWAKGIPNYPDSGWYATALAGHLLVETGLGEKDPETELSGSQQTIRESVIGRLRDIVESGVMEQTDRVAAAADLGHLGDPRSGVGLKDGLPDIEWCLVEKGNFLYGDVKETRRIEHDFKIAKYPVTAAQYQAFIGDGGYSNENWWGAGGFGKFERPEDYSEIYQTPNHPRVGISWYEAKAFCAWLTARLCDPESERITLPNELQWERAARHTDGWKYPWGDDMEGLVQRCNHNNELGHTSAVGAFPSGEAKCGGHDFSGNVWEWCGNWYDEEKYRVLRGGSSGTIQAAFVAPGGSGFLPISETSALVFE